MPLDLQPAVVWIGALALILNFGLSVWNLLASGSRENAKRLESHAGRLGDHDQRLTGLEQRLSAVPAQGDLHQVQLAWADARRPARDARDHGPDGKHRRPP